MNACMYVCMYACLCTGNPSFPWKNLLSVHIVHITCTTFWSQLALTRSTFYCILQPSQCPTPTSSPQCLLPFYLHFSNHNYSIPFNMTACTTLFIYLAVLELLPMSSPDVSFTRFRQWPGAKSEISLRVFQIITKKNHTAARIPSQMNLTGGKPRPRLIHCL